MLGLVAMFCCHFVMEGVTVHRQWNCLTGSQRTDLSPLKINTTGRLPSGFCHRLHPLKSSPDPRVCPCHSRGP